VDTKAQNAIWDIETLQETIGVIPYEEMELNALKRAIVALEKQIPKITKESHGKHICPACGRLYWEKSYICDYCDKCGQRLEVEQDG
jgi:hypothetical protein